jgi:hypothetical protein
MRCATRLKADALSENGSATKPGQKEMKKAFDAVDAAARDHDASLLVPLTRRFARRTTATKAAKSP